MKIPVIEALKTMQTGKRIAKMKYVTFEQMTDFSDLGPGPFGGHYELRTSAAFDFLSIVDERAKSDVAFQETHRHAAIAIAREIYKPVIDELHAIQEVCWQQGEEVIGKKISALIDELSGRTL